MKSSLLIAILILSVLVGGFFIFKDKTTVHQPGPATAQNPSPVSSSPIPSPTLSPEPSPSQFDFNSTTDLKAEINSVDPQVKSPNLETLRKLIKSL